MTVILVSLGIGAVVGTALGFKMGRGYERLRPAKKKDRKRKRAV